MRQRKYLLFWMIVLLVAAGCGGDEATPEPTDVPLAGAVVPTRQPTDTATSTPSPTVTSTATNTATRTPSPTDTPTATNTTTATPTDTATSTPSPTETATQTPSPTKTPTLTSSPTSTTTQTPTSAPTQTPTSTTTQTPTSMPTQTPTLPPTATRQPTATPAPTQLRLEGGTLDADSAVGGVITDGNYGAEYTLEATAGDVVTLVMYAASGDLDSQLTLLDPNGDRIAFNDDVPDDALDNLLGAAPPDALIGTFELPVSGIYTVIAERFGAEFGTTTGNYALSLLVEESGEQMPIVTTDTEDGVIEYGEAVNGEITNFDYFVDYTFTGSANDIISISMDEISGDLDPYISLLNTEGEEVAFNDDDPSENTLNAFLSTTLPADGNYIIRATRFNQQSGDSTGQFRLTLMLEVSGVAASTENANAIIPLTLGETVAGTLTQEVYTRRYSFNGAGGQQITVRMDASSGNLLPMLVLLDEDGQPLAMYDSAIIDDDGSAIIDAFELPDDGTYTIVAVRSGANLGVSVGSYTLEISEEVVGGVIASEVELIAYGDDLVGAFTGDDVRPSVYTFAAQAGDFVTANVSALNDELDTTLTLENASGDLIVYNDDNLFDENFTNSEIFGALIPEDGYYNLIVEAYDGGVGEFALSLSLDERIVDGERPLRGVVDPRNSLGVTVEGDRLFYMAIGDWTGGNGDLQDVATSAIVTIKLPELPDDAVVDQATLDLFDCFEFSEIDLSEQFGELVISANDTYEDNTQITIAVSDDAVELGTVTGCGFLDVTEFVEDAYEDGSSLVQFYITFSEPSPVENEATDSVILIGPLLEIFTVEE